MTEDKMRPNVNDRSEQAKSRDLGQQAQQNQASAAQPDKPMAPGRKPLFGNSGRTPRFGSEDAHRRR